VTAGTNGARPGSRRDTGFRARVGRELGLEPTTAEVVTAWLDAALPVSAGSALDAGCGRLSHLKQFRSRLDRFSGVDIHEPALPLGWLDEFRVADLCVDADAFEPDSFDVALSNFTVEHFADPVAAFRMILGWLRPSGTLVITTVNRAHPFVDAYCSIPAEVRGRLQPFVKMSAADAHPVVGACNTPRLIRDGLIAAGYEDIRIVTTDHLARAWGRTLPTWGLGLIGDVAAHTMPARRSTIVAQARRPAASTTSDAAGR